MPFQNIKIKTFDLSDLVDRTVKIKSFKDDCCELIIAVDVKSGELFVLKENHFPGIAQEQKITS